MRHIATATVDDRSVRVVYDCSTEKYKFRCDRINPRYEEFTKRGGILTADDNVLEDFVMTPVLTKWADTLKGLGEKIREELRGEPEFEIAPKATPEEVKTLLGV
jgi:hypothetical protein